MRISTSGGATSQRALVPNGRLVVPPAFYQTGSSTAVQLDAANDLLAQKVIFETPMRYGGVRTYFEAVATEGIFDILIYSDDGAADSSPDSLIITCRSGYPTGAAGATWLNTNFTSTGVLSPNTPYWFVYRGTDGDDFSLSCAAADTTVGSAFPDCMPSAKYSTDGGSSWSALTSNSKPACVNMIWNPTANVAPYLTYAQYNGNQIYLPGTGIRTIPDGATTMIYNCEALTDGTLYYVYVYDNSGTMTLDVTTTSPSEVDGILVKTGATTRRYVGMIVPKTLSPGQEGPVDCMDSRLVMNHYNKVPKVLGKLCPYSGATSDTGVLDSWEGWNGSATEWKFDFVSDGSTIPIEYTALGVTGAGETVYAALGLDEVAPCETVAGSSVGASETAALIGHGGFFPARGYHYGVPIQKAAAANSGDLHFETAATVYSGTSSVKGIIWC